jgi:hypothetical protein
VGYRFSEGEPPRPIGCDGALDGGVMVMRRRPDW